LKPPCAWYLKVYKHNRINDHNAGQHISPITAGTLSGFPMKQTKIPPANPSGMENIMINGKQQGFELEAITYKPR
jgi:hypothetical protein